MLIVEFNQSINQSIFKEEEEEKKTAPSHSEYKQNKISKKLVDNGWKTKKKLLMNEFE